MSNTEALRAALQAAREARGSIPLGAERSALNVALDRQYWERRRERLQNTRLIAATTGAAA